MDWTRLGKDNISKLDSGLPVQIDDSTVSKQWLEGGGGGFDLLVVVGEVFFAGYFNNGCLLWHMATVGGNFSR